MRIQIIKIIIKCQLKLKKNIVLIENSYQSGQ